MSDSFLDFFILIVVVTLVVGLNLLTNGVIWVVHNLFGWDLANYYWLIASGWLLIFSFAILIKGEKK